MTHAHIFSPLTTQQTHNSFKIPVNLQSVTKTSNWSTRMSSYSKEFEQYLDWLRGAHSDKHRCRQINCENNIDFSINNNPLPEVNLFLHIQLKLMWH